MRKLINKKIFGIYFTLQWNCAQKLLVLMNRVVSKLASPVGDGATVFGLLALLLSDALDGRI